MGEGAADAMRDTGTSRKGVERLGSEGVGRLLFGMSAQTTLALLAYAIYSLTDTYFLSVGIGPLAAAGASVVSPLLILLGGLATVVGSGGASLVSRALGEGNRELASRAVAATMAVFWAAALLVACLGAIFIEPLALLLGATEAVLPYAVGYGRIILLGAVTATGFSALVRADGSARYSTAMWLSSILANIVLCWLFVMVFHWGVEGAAIATVLGQSVSTLMSLYFFFARRGRPYAIKARHFLPERAVYGGIIAVGLPSLLKSLGASIVVIVTNNLLKATGGDTALATFAIVGRLYSALATPQTGVVQGMQPLVGYSLGQGRPDRASRALRLALVAVAAWGLAACALCLLAPGFLLGLLSRDVGVVTGGQGALRLLALALPFSGFSLAAAAAFQSAGRAREALALTLGGFLLVKLPVLLASSRLFGLDGIWASEAASELVLAALSLVLLRFAPGLREPKTRSASALPS